VLLRLPYFAVSSMFALMRLLPMSDVDKDIEILTLRHQLAVLQRQIDRPRVTPADRAFLAALLHRLPRPKLRQLHLIVSPDSILRWHRDLIRRRHADASRRKRPGRPPTHRSIRVLVLRLARESFGTRIRGETIRCPRRTRGSSRARAASKARSGQLGLGAATSRRSTATSWRKISISASLAAADQGKRTSHAKM
jgi:hypothetical protein